MPTKQALNNKRRKVYCYKGMNEISLLDSLIINFSGYDSPEEIVLPLNQYQLEIILFLLHEYRMKVLKMKSFNKQMQKALEEMLPKLTNAAKNGKLELEPNWHEKYCAEKQAYRDFQTKCLKEWHKTQKLIKKIKEKL